jgi:hypothetical protein
MMAGTLLAMAVVVAGVLNAHAGRGQNHGYDKAPASHGHGLHGDLSDDSIGKAQQRLPHQLCRLLVLGRK